MDDVDPEIWFDVAQTRDGATATRQNRGFLNVEREEGRKRNEVRKFFWSQRVIDPWNNLPDAVKQALITCGKERQMANDRPYYK